ncbi:hypothetical protein F2Q70_00035992 [Brassica cretica]|uniref:Uncharacterized protein n=1 Tax=Brassica cretica TaxID=69181 RepID=A0A8S9JQQ5_BRACR|nr:hypothetical protein F2Q70_00035992 [Brassica cretica]
MFPVLPSALRRRHRRVDPSTGHRFLPEEVKYKTRRSSLEERKENELEGEETETEHQQSDGIKTKLKNKASVGVSMASYTMVPASLQVDTMGSRRDAKYCLCKSTTKLAWFLHHVRQRFCSDELFMAMSSYPGLNCSRNHRIHWQGKSVSRWKAGNQGKDSYLAAENGEAALHMSSLRISLC